MLKAIETIYKGYRFRSRLEARWAVFFDALGLKWGYEVEGFDLGKAGWYLPDFVLHSTSGTWLVEVKPNMYAIPDSALRKIFAAHRACQPAYRGLIVLDDTPAPLGYLTGGMLESTLEWRNYWQSGRHVIERVIPDPEWPFMDEIAICKDDGSPFLGDCFDLDPTPGRTGYFLWGTKSKGPFFSTVDCVDADEMAAISDACFASRSASLDGRPRRG